jgi:hypothetical protein
LHRAPNSRILAIVVHLAREETMQRPAQKRAIAIAAQQQVRKNQLMLAASLLLLPSALLLLLISPW